MPCSRSPRRGAALGLALLLSACQPSSAPSDAHPAHQHGEDAAALTITFDKEGQCTISLDGTRFSIAGRTDVRLVAPPAAAEKAPHFGTVSCAGQSTSDSTGIALHIAVLLPAPNGSIAETTHTLVEPDRFAAVKYDSATVNVLELVRGEPARFHSVDGTLRVSKATDSLFVASLETHILRTAEPTAPTPTPGRAEGGTR